MGDLLQIKFLLGPVTFKFTASSQQGKGFCWKTGQGAHEKKYSMILPAGDTREQNEESAHVSGPWDESFGQGQKSCVAMFLSHTQKA
jgi:hypothetical protein